MLITKILLIISLIFLSSQIINADYTSQLALAKNQAFIDRVQVGMLAAAIAVSNETTTVQNHPNRIKLAKDIIGDPNTWATKIALTVAAEGSITNNSGTDATLLTVISSVWDAIAGK